jgi:hypothetical protein
MEKEENKLDNPCCFLFPSSVHPRPILEGIQGNKRAAKAYLGHGDGC